MTALAGDLRYSLRQFRKAPVFSITVLLVLALGVGATTAIFTLFDQALLRALPVVHPQELVRLSADGSFRGRLSSQGGSIEEYFSYPAYKYLRDNNRVFSGMLATYTGGQVGVSWQGQTELLQPELVSGNYFEVLGIRPALGRLLQSSDDDVKNGSPVAVLSYGYWQRHFAADPKVIGQSLLVNGHLFTVAGVTPPGFKSVVTGNAPDLFFPMMMKTAITPDWDDLENHKSRWLNIVARLRPGVSRAAAQAGIAALWRTLRLEEMRDQEEQSASFRTAYVDKSHLTLLDGKTGFSPLRDKVETPLKVLMGLAGLVLLMACANVASLLLVRAAGRVKEMSIRYALGARRKGIVRQLLIEGLLLGLAGGLVGIAAAEPVAAFLIRAIQGQTPGEPPYSAHPDLRLLIFSFLITLAVSLLFSLAPALQFWKPNMAPALKQQTVTAAGSALLLRRITVGIQIGLSVLLLASSGLFIRTLSNLKNVGLGFSPDHLVQFGIDPRLAGYRSEDVFALDQRVLSTLRGLPGAQSVGATDDAELTGNGTQNFYTIPGYVPKERNETQGEWSGVSGDYFKTLDIPVFAGRAITDSDTEQRQRVINVSRGFADHYFGGPQQAIGHSIKKSKAVQGEPQAWTIVGVVGDTRHANPRDPIGRRVFASYLQQDPNELYFYFRTAGDPAASIRAVRLAMAQLDPRLALDGLQTMDMQRDQALVQERTLALLASSFGVLAVLMAAIGIYGVLAYATAQRTREIGVRMALGASRAAVGRLVVYEVLRLAGVSILAAVPIAYGIGKAAQSLLFGIGGADPVVLVVVVLVVSMVAACAAALPARRAASVEPMQALRYE